MSDKTRVSWMPAMQKHLLRRQRRANGIGKSPFEHWHNRWSGQSWRLSPKHHSVIRMDLHRPSLNPQLRTGHPAPRSSWDESRACGHRQLSGRDPDRFSGSPHDIRNRLRLRDSEILSEVSLEFVSLCFDSERITRCSIKPKGTPLISSLWTEARRVRSFATR